MTKFNVMVQMQETKLAPFHTAISPCNDFFLSHFVPHVFPNVCPNEIPQ